MKQPVICFTGETFEFHGNGGHAVEGRWQGLDLINDEPAKHELYFHFKADRPEIIVTKGLEVSHDEIKKMALQFWKEASTKN